MRSLLTLARAALLTVAASCLTLSPPAHAQTCPTHYAHVTATNIGARTPLQAGVLIVTATDASQNAINYSVPGFGIELTIPKYIPISNGALMQTLCLPRSDQTSTHVGYHFIVRDSSPSGGNRIVLDAPNVGIASDNWSLDSYDFSGSPNPYTLTLTAQVPVDGSPGAKGDPGPPALFRGNYNSGTAYAAGDAAFYTDGSSYVSLQNGNVGKVPGVDTAWWGLLAQHGATGGGTTASQLGAALTTAEYTRTSAVENLLDPAKVAMGQALNADGSTSPNSAVNTTGFIPYYGPSICNSTILAYVGYDALFAVTAVGGSVSPNTSFSLPTGTAFFKLLFLSSVTPSTISVNNSTTPQTFRPFGPGLVQSDLTAAINTINANVAASQLAIIKTARKTLTSANPNLIIRSATNYGTALNGGGTLDANSATSTSDYLIGDSQLVTNAHIVAVAAYDSSFTLLGFPANPTAGVGFTSSITGTKWLRLTTDTTGDALKTWGVYFGSSLPTFTFGPSRATRSLTFTVDAGGSIVGSGRKQMLVVPYDCYIVSMTIASGGGKVTHTVADIRKLTGAAYAGGTSPNSAGSITGSAPPTLSGGILATDSTLTGWNRLINAGEVLWLNINSNDVASYISVTLEVVEDNG